MAARTSASVGVGVTITLLGVATLGLFITSMVFFAQRREALTAKADLEKVTEDYLSPQDRSDAVVLRLKDEANKHRPKQTVVRFMLDEHKDLYQKVTGSERDTVAAVDAILKKANASSMLAALRDRDSQIESLQKQLADSDAARNRALQDKENESKRVQAIEASQKESLAALNATVDQTKADADALRDQVNGFKKDMDARVEGIRSDFANKESAYKSEIEKAQATAAVNRERIRTYEEQLRGQHLSGQPEYALVDGQIISTSPTEGTVTLNIGRHDKVVLGMPFNVYNQGTTIKVDEKTGEYPPGKATIEIIRVEERSSIARILREQKGNPVLRGDFIANPIYDPAKSYKFVVYGNFDPDRTGNASAFGGNEIKAWIKDWGGKISDELTGDVDFVVLGQRPQLPPQPPGNAAIELINFYVAQQKAATRYDELLKQATDAAIPVLNENRLRTLLGR